MRAVLDTNVLVSAYFWEGHERRAFQAGVEGKYELVTSPFLLAEVGGVLEARFRLPREAVSRYVRTILVHARLVKPPETLRVVEQDPDDDRVLEAALAGRADCIVTGDRDLLDLKAYESVAILSPREFLARLP